MQLSKTTEQTGDGDLATHPNGGGEDMKEDTNGEQAGGKHDESLSVREGGQHIAGLKFAIVEATGLSAKQHRRAEVDGVL